MTNQLINSESFIVTVSGKDYYGKPVTVTQDRVPTEEAADKLRNTYREVIDQAKEDYQRFYLKQMLLTVPVTTETVKMLSRTCESSGGHRRYDVEDQGEMTRDQMSKKLKHLKGVSFWVKIRQEDFLKIQPTLEENKVAEVKLCQTLIDIAFARAICTHPSGVSKEQLVLLNIPVPTRHFHGVDSNWVVSVIRQEPLVVDNSNAASYLSEKYKNIRDPCWHCKK